MTDLAHGLRLLSTLACGIVVIAFVLFAVDHRDDANQFAQTPAVATTVEQEHDGARGIVENLNDTLVAPFEGVATSDDPWIVNGLPALLALIAYGLLGRLLIGYIPERR